MASSPHTQNTTPEVQALGSVAINWPSSLSEAAAAPGTVTERADFPSLADLRLPQVPGYEVMRVLGRGGMGVVYQALQLALNRTVALKMILRGVQASELDLARFRAEAEAVAKLSHPHIVQVYDVGIHDGQPYCALEMLPGGSLDQRLQGRPLPPQQAAVFLEQLARGIQAAHEEGIIHRDLKPGNVLMTADGTPKITDFGLAKRVEDSAGHTRTGDIVGTPAYMSPEQAAGEVRAVGPASDIYALGAMLYEMLTGRHPFLGVSATDVLLQVISVEPVPPGRLRPGIPVDLETICLKCLHKEPHRRYASAAALAEDLRRFLADQPIQARPVTTWERAWRWCRRNPLPTGLATAAGLLGLALAVGGPVAAYREAGLRREAELARGDAFRERDRAAQAHQRTRDALDAMTSQVASEWLTAQQELRPEQIRFLEQAVRYYQEFAAEQATDIPSRVQLALGNRQLAALLHRLGKQKEAEAAYRQALALFAELLRDQPGHLGCREQAAVTEGHLGLLLAKTGRLDEAEAALRHNLAVFVELTKQSPDATHLLLNLASGYGNLAVLLTERGQKPEAEKLHQQAQTLFEQVVQRDPDDPKNRRNLAVSLGNRCILLRDLGRWAEAEATGQRALTLRREMVAAAGNYGDPASELVASLIIMGDFYRERMQLDPADQIFREAVGLMEKIAAEYPTDPEYRHSLALCYNKHSLVLSRQHRWAEAESVLRKAMLLRQRLVADFPERPDYRYGLAGCHSNLGMVLGPQKRYEEAEREYRAALKLQQALTQEFPHNHDYREELAVSHGGLGGLYHDQARRPEAEQHFRRALELREQLVAALPGSMTYRKQLAIAHNELGLVLSLLKRHAEAEAAHRQSLRLQEQLAAEFPATLSLRLDLGGSCCNFANNLKATGQVEESLKWYAKAIAHLESVLAKTPRHLQGRRFLRNSHTARASALSKLHRHIDAVPDRCKAVALDDQKLDLIRQLYRECFPPALNQLREQAKDDAAAFTVSVERLARTPGVPATFLVEMARLGLQAGQPESALLCLKQAEQAGAFQDTGLTAQLRDHPDWQPLRSHPDFQALLRSLP